MAFTWSSMLETGHPAIDSQHKELVSAVNHLLEACQRGQGATKVGETLDFLVSYTQRHFRDEEAVQIHSQFPEYVNHHKLHQDFVKSVGNLSAELKRTGPTPELVHKIIHDVGDWLVSHIQQQDVKIAAHLKKSKTNVAVMKT